jgi:hypothetical protein
MASALVAASGIGAFFAVGGVVGLRLLLLWLRTRRPPEGLAGAGLLGIGPLGFCVMVLAQLGFAGTPAARPIFAVGLLVQAAGTVAAAAFTWVVFRRGCPWAQGLVWASAILLVASWLLYCADSGEFAEVRPWLHPDVAIKVGVLGWGGAESLRYWRLLRRRLALGFGDPVVAASFLMWGIALASGALSFVVIYAYLLLVSPRGGSRPWIDFSLSLFGIVSAASLWLAFLPPRWYARRVVARAAATGV